MKGLTWNHKDTDMGNQLYEQLRSEHDQVKELLSELQETNGRAVKKRERLFDELRHELIPHMQGEEKTLYPALQERDQARKLAMEALEEHHAAKLLLRELEKLDKGDEAWAAKLKVMKEMIEHHIEEEEGEIFEKGRDVLGDETLEMIGEQYQKAEEKAMARVK